MLHDNNTVLRAYTKYTYDDLDRMWLKIYKRASTKGKSIPKDKIEDEIFEHFFELATREDEVIHTRSSIADSARRYGLKPKSVEFFTEHLSVGICHAGTAGMNDQKDADQIAEKLGDPQAAVFWLMFHGKIEYRPYILMQHLPKVKLTSEVIHVLALGTIAHERRHTIQPIKMHEELQAAWDVLTREDAWDEFKDYVLISEWDAESTAMATCEKYLKS